MGGADDAGKRSRSGERVGDARPLAHTGGKVIFLAATSSFV